MYQYSKYRRSTLGLRFAGIVLALTACGEGKATVPAAAPASIPSSASGLTLVELEFYESGELGAKLGADGSFQVKQTRHHDGKSTVSWSTLATLARDGSFTHDGQLAGRLRPDGSFVLADGSSAGFRIEGVTLTMGDKHVTIGDHGVFTINSESSSLRVEGLSDDGSRRTALLLFAVMSAPGAHAGGARHKPAQEDIPASVNAPDVAPSSH